jgi:hypothetical protein
MLSPARGLLRGLRAASLGVTGFVLALVAHVAAGGVAPGPVVLLVLAVVIGLVTVRFTGARLSPVRIGISLSAMQVVLHEVLMRLGEPSGCLMTAESAPAVAHLGRGQLMLGCATGMAHSGMGQRSVLAAPTMVAAHAAATVVMGALLAYGEKVLWILSEVVRPPRWLRAGPPEPPAVRVVSSGAPPMLNARYAYGGVGRRGPPPQGLFSIV